MAQIIILYLYLLALCIPLVINSVSHFIYKDSSKYENAVKQACAGSIVFNIVVIFWGGNHLFFEISPFFKVLSFVFHLFVVGLIVQDFCGIKSFSTKLSPYILIVPLSLVLSSHYLVLLLVLVSCLIRISKIEKTNQISNYSLLMISILAIGSTLYYIGYPSYYYMFSIVIFLIMYLGLPPYLQKNTDALKRDTSYVYRYGLNLLPVMALLYRAMFSNIFLDYSQFISITVAICLIGNILILMVQTNMWKLHYYIRNIYILCGLLLINFGGLETGLSVWVVGIIFSCTFAIITNHIASMTGSSDIRNLSSLKSNYSFYYLSYLALMLPFLGVPGTSGLFIYSSALADIYSHSKSSSLVYLGCGILFLFQCALVRIVWFTLIKSEESIEGQIDNDVDISFKVFLSSILIIILGSIFMFLPREISNDNSYIFYRFIIGSKLANSTLNNEFSSITMLLSVLSIVGAIICCYFLYIKNIGSHLIERFKYRFCFVWNTFDSEFSEVAGFRYNNKIYDFPFLVIDIVNKAQRFTLTSLLRTSYDIKDFIAVKVYEIRPKGINSNLLFMSVSFAIIVLTVVMRL